MKKLLCLLLAAVLTVSCLGGVCFAADPIAVVINGEEETKVYNTDEIKLLISYDGTTVVKMLRDFIQEESTFIYRVPTFTLDLNGFTAGTKGGTAIGVHYEGTANSTTVIKNGVLVAGTGSGVAMNIQVGGMRAENVVFTCDSGNTVLGVYQLSDKWNDDNLITGCTIVGNSSSAIAFNSTTDPQTNVSIKVENSTLINAKTGKGTYAVNQRQVPGGTVVFGKSVNVYSTEQDGAVHPQLTAAGETLSYVGEKAKVDVEKLGLSIDNLYHWATPEGDFSNWKSDFVLPEPEKKAEDPIKTLPITPTKTFRDVKKSFWAYDAVTTAAASGILDGMTAADAKDFAPDASITETEFRQVLSVFFADQAILDANAGAEALSREAMAQILYAAASSFKAYEGTEKASSVPDIASVTEGIREDVLWLYGAGLLKGMDKKGTFAPANALTRAQTAQILARLLHKERNFDEYILPVINVEETLENRQRAYVTTALSYYHKNPYVQYDWIGLSRAGLPYGRRYHEDINRNAPEYASPDNTEYFVCACWATVLGEQVFNYRLMGGPDSSVTKNLSAVKPSQLEDGIFVYQYKNTGDEEKDRASVEKVKSLLQNGDVVTWTLKSGYGHTGIYIDDVTGDGQPDFIHCSDNGGGRYVLETGIDKFEQNGGIFINRTTGASSAADMLFDDASATALIGTVRYSIVRPAALDAKQYPIQDHVKTRMAYEGLAVYYTAEYGYYSAVEKGQELTYTLTVKNNSQEAYRGLKVQIPNYENAYITKLDGKAYNEPTVTMYLDVPAGESVTHTVTMKAVGEVGSEINSCGYVHTVKLPVMHTSITSHAPKAEDFTKDSAIKAAAAAENNLEAFANTYYKAATGKEANIPAVDEILEAAFKKSRLSAYNMYAPKKEADTALYEMLVIDYYGGRNVMEKNGVSHRVVETVLQDFLPGDVMLMIPNERDRSLAEMWVFDGELFRALEDGKVVTRGMLDVMKLHSRDLFVLLRPAQMP